MLKHIHSQGNRLLVLAFVLPVLFLAGCGAFPSSGPSTSSAKSPDKDALENIRVVEVDKPLIDKFTAARKGQTFSETFIGASPAEYRVGKGDVLEITIWEAPPATLFITTLERGDLSIGMSKLPEQMVRNDGTVSIPFSGAVPAAGYTTAEIEQDIIHRLKNKANQPQVLVRVVHNATANVTVIGEFEMSATMPLTSKGERLLDAVAAVKGVRQPVGQMTLQLARGDMVRRMPMEKVLEDPRQNVYLQPDDVVTALHQPLSISVLGAMLKNGEINFETSGINLAEAIARAGGLVDARADAKGLFVFRYEGAEPVIYSLNLDRPASLFLAQGFDMHDKDVVYVSNAPSTDLYKFLDLLGVVSRTAAPAVQWSRIH